MISYLEKTFGVWSPVGGTAALVEGLVKLIEGQGASIRYGAEVKQITIAEGVARGVELANGERLAADVVVSNADAAFTYKNLVAPKWRRAWGDTGLKFLAYSRGLFVWYFGVNRRYDDIAHHTILLGPRYREHLRDIFDKRVLAEDFSLYLHRPTATDPSLTPRLRHVLRARPRAQSSGRSGLDKGGRALAPAHRRVAEIQRAARPRKTCRDLQSHDAAGF